MKHAGSFLIALTVLSATSTVHGSPITMINHGPSSNRVDIVFGGWLHGYRHQRWHLRQSHQFLRQYACSVLD